MKVNTVRINVTVPNEINEILERWSKMTGASKSKTVSMFLQSSLPALAEVMDKVERGESLEDLASLVATLNTMTN